MFCETAVRIKAILALMELEGATVINFGSSTEEFCKTRQPWIWAEVLAPVVQRGAQLVNVDEKADGTWIQRSDLPQDESADVMLCCSLLEHVPDAKETLGAMRQSLKVGGKLVLDVPAEYPYHPDPIDTGLRIHSREECEELLGRGFQVEHFEIVQCVGFPHSAALAVARRVC